MAGETAWLTVVRGAPAESLLAADGTVNDGGLVAGRANTRTGRGGLQGDAFEPAANPAGATRIPVATHTEVPGVLAFATCSCGQWAGCAALVTDIGAGPRLRVTGCADSPAILGASVDSPLSAANRAGLFFIALCATSPAFASVQSVIPTQGFDSSAAETLALDDGAGHLSSTRQQA
ncbi:hypothetical protein U6G28_06500 [Actinomycetaceae bacterium MB13-C1-2]|nr:hypothetical protein U6G28_06500 [Actinomycetaceae bacterium MB13-C1-2]